MEKFNEEDKKNHVSAAGVFICKNVDGKLAYLIQDHVKHNMLTFPIGKCKENESPIDGLKTEMREELGVEDVSAVELFNYTKTYDFTGKPIEIKTVVYSVTNCIGTPINMEPDKCRSLKWMTFDEIKKQSNEGIRIADCVRVYFKQAYDKEV